MIKEFNDYITREYYTLLNIANKMTKGDSYAGDLLNDVLVQIYDKPQLKLRTIDDNSIKYYIVAIMRINWFSKTSPFYRKIRRESSMYNELELVKEIVQQDDNLDDHKLIDLMEEEWAELDWFRKKIFEKYMIMGSLKRVSKDTSIPLTSIARYVNTAKEDIKHSIFKKMK
jgi:hypothetical protein